MVDIDKVKAEGNRILRCTQEGTPLERQVWEACLKDCLDAIEQLKKTLALRMIMCDSLQKRVAELESEVKAGAHLAAVAGDRNRELESRVAELEKFARHSGACASIYSNDKCDCGYEEALSRKDGE